MKTVSSKKRSTLLSIIYFQLGLVLTLGMVYTLFEYRTYNEAHKPKTVITSNPEVDEDETIEITIERKQPVAKQKSRVTPLAIQKQVNQSIIEVVDDNLKDVVESVIKVDEGPAKNNNNMALVDVEVEDFAEDVDFAIIEDAPIYPGCEKYTTETDQRACFDKKFGKLIQRKFNNDLASSLGLSSGPKKIYVKFKITKTGEVEIMDASAPHVRLEKEGKRVIGLLPKMTPGKQRGRPVSVIYTKPISFLVE